METRETTENIADIPTQVINGFLDKLSADNVPNDQVKRLRATLFGEDELTDYTIKQALFPEDDPT